MTETAAVSPQGAETPTRYQHIQVAPMAGALGAEVAGVDLGHLDADVLSEIHQAWLEHQVLFFRDQSLTPEQHMAFAGYFGEFQESGYMPTIEGFPFVYKQEYPKLYGGVTSDITWHIDAAFLERPLKGAVLYALQVPPVGGDTAWTSLSAAYEALSEPTKAYLRTLNAVHDNLHGTLDTALERFGAESLAQVRKAVPPHKHPLVCTHPETGRPSLFFSELMVSHIDGLTKAESRYLVAFLAEHCSQPEFQCRFRWENGSVAFWDNRCTAHKGVMDFGDAYRLMHRVGIKGDAEPAA